MSIVVYDVLTEDDVQQKIQSCLSQTFQSCNVNFVPLFESIFIYVILICAMVSLTSGLTQCCYLKHKYKFFVIRKKEFSEKKFTGILKQYSATFILHIMMYTFYSRMPVELSFKNES